MRPRKYTNIPANKGIAVGFFACKFIRFIFRVLRAFKSVFFVFMCLYNWIYNYASTDKEKSIKKRINNIYNNIEYI